MGALVYVTSYGAGVAASPIRIAAITLMLLTPGGARSARYFVGGFVVGLTAIALAVVALGSGHEGG